MTAAVASPISALHEAYKQRTGGGLAPLNTDVTERTNRYVWQGAEDIPHSEATAGYVALLRDRAKQLNIPLTVTAGFIERCRVAPILAMPVWDRTEDVPLEMRVRFRDQKPNGDFEQAQYLIQPGGIFDSVLEMYEGWGVRELRALRGFDANDFLELQIDDVFFPMVKDRNQFDAVGRLLDQIPRTYREMKQRLMQRASYLPADGRRTTLEAVAADMLHSLEVSAAFDNSLVDREEEPGQRYSNHGLRALTRLERERRDHALNRMAERQNAVFDKLPDVIAAQKPAEMPMEQFSIFAKEIAKSIAETMRAEFQQQATSVPTEEPKSAPPVNKPAQAQQQVRRS